MKVIDNLEDIIGKQPDAVDSFDPEAKNRFNCVFMKFLKCVASINSPLTTVVEDL